MSDGSSRGSHSTMVVVLQHKHQSMSTATRDHRQQAPRRTGDGRLGGPHPLPGSSAWEGQCRQPECEPRRGRWCDSKSGPSCSFGPASHVVTVAGRQTEVGSNGSCAVPGLLPCRRSSFRRSRLPHALHQKRAADGQEGMPGSATRGGHWCLRASANAGQGSGAGSTPSQVRTRRGPSTAIARSGGNRAAARRRQLLDVIPRGGPGEGKHQGSDSAAP
jgi:hypothetical protein